MSANLNNDKAKKQLIYDYIHNINKNQNYDLTVKFYEITAEYGYSLNFLGYMYRNGIFFKVDYKKAIELYEKAVKLNNSCAMINLAHMYKQGYGMIFKNYKKSKKLYKMAIKLDNSMAMAHLACMYRYGEGVKRDFKKTIDYYIMAAGHNHTGAEKELKYIIQYQDGLIEYRNEQINIKEYIEECITKLEEEIHQLDLEIADVKYKPGGIEYYNVKKDFEDRIKIK